MLIGPIGPDMFMRALGALAGFFCLLWLIQTFRLARARRALREEQLRERSREFRLERFDLLWYPTVAFSPRAKTITSVKAGLPHCRKCLQALKLVEEDWTCAPCGTKYPESAADIATIDAVSKQAVDYFRERHPDYQQAAPAAPAKS